MRSCSASLACMVPRVSLLSADLFWGTSAQEKPKLRSCCTEAVQSRREKVSYSGNLLTNDRANSIRFSVLPILTECRR